MISTSGITMNFGQKVLFENVSIKFTPGNCYGLIGANGVLISGTYAGQVTASIDGMLAAREAAVRQAGREEVLTRVETLHRPFYICGDCDHDHTDKDIREGRAFDTGYSYTCEAALEYWACLACCVSNPDNPEQSEECATYHEHTLNPDDRCATAALVARLRRQA